MVGFALLNPPYEVRSKEFFMMKLPRRKFLRLAATAAAVPVLPRAALAQTYPSRPVRWIVPYPAGGATDLISRLIGQWLTERLGQAVIIDNRPGGGTNIGTQAVVSSPPDGYTLLFTASTHTINVSLQQLPFNFLRDITLVSGLAELPLVMDVSPKLPVKDLKEFVAYAKANPGKVNVASFGAATISHLAIEFFKATTGVDVVHVPYRGGAQIMADLISGQIQAAVDSLPSSLPHIKSGAIRGLALLSAERTSVLPDLPAANEIIPGLEVRTFSGVGVPSGTPPEIVERLNKEINAGLANSTIKARFADVGASPVIMTSAEANAFVKAQTEKWAKVIKEAGIKAE
jgi:tripartite-type tricarboxylate transporter receptor subunit TctC